MAPTMIFDGDCVLCSGTVRFVLAHERSPALHFTTTQSAAGQALAAQHGFSAGDLDNTFVLVEGGRALTRSEAALSVARHLKAPWRWLGVLRVVPGPLRDAAYTAIARRRYRLFGRMESCFMPDATARHRFLSDPPATATAPGREAGGRGLTRAGEG
jgi:predicted DCC family thiol-disulfide oxidoreductase YuxK